MLTLLQLQRFRSQRPKPNRTLAVAGCRSAELTAALRSPPARLSGAGALVARAGRLPPRHSRAGHARCSTRPLAQRRSRRAGQGELGKGRRADGRGGGAEVPPCPCSLRASTRLVRCELGAAACSQESTRACFYFGGLIVAASCWALGLICNIWQLYKVYLYVFMFVSKILGIPWHTGEYPWRRPCNELRSTFM